MKTIKVIIYLLIVAILLMGCNTDGKTSHVYQYFNFNNFFISKDGNITIEVQYNFADKNETFFISQNKNIYKWYKNKNTYPFFNQKTDSKKFSIDDKALLCYAEETETYWDSFVDFQCHLKEENEIVTKKLFGDIYNEGYREIIIGYVKKYATPSPLLYFFDSNNNMHLFYNDTKHAKGKYFYYVMFTDNEPTIPKYEQKIEWEK